MQNLSQIDDEFCQSEQTFVFYRVNLSLSPATIGARRSSINENTEFAELLNKNALKEGEPDYF